jgi:UDP-2,3-diacylglucosamine pyrophosphatase LpxH
MVDTIILSDLHLGTRDSKTEEIIQFLENTPCKTLILNGDIIDGWALNKGAKWKKRHTKVVNTIFKISENSQVIWIRGNHDEFLDDFIGYNIGNIKILKNHIININKWITEDKFENKRYYVFHGDDIDIFILKYKWLSKIGSVGYDIALWLNTQYNRWRKFRGLKYKSISKPLKQKVKTAANYVNDFENAASKMAEFHGCQGVICGHIHQEMDRMIDNIHYLNSGDWVESMTAILIHDDGKIEIIHYKPIEDNSIETL